LTGIVLDSNRHVEARPCDGSGIGTGWGELERASMIDNVTIWKSSLVAGRDSIERSLIGSGWGLCLGVFRRLV
jgi:hypothetical protein